MDPLAEQTMEPYSYVGNNPIMFTDPTGMSKEQEGGGWWSTMKSFLGMGSSKKQEASTIPVTELDEIIINTKTDISNEMSALQFGTGITTNILNDQSLKYLDKSFYKIGEYNPYNSIDFYNQM